MAAPSSTLQNFEDNCGETVGRALFCRLLRDNNKFKLVDWDETLTLLKVNISKEVKRACFEGIKYIKYSRPELKIKFNLFFSFLLF